MAISPELEKSFENWVKDPSELLWLLKKYGFDSKEILAIVETSPIDSLYPDVVSSIIEYWNIINWLRKKKMQNLVNIVADSDISYIKKAS